MPLIITPCCLSSDPQRWRSFVLVDIPILWAENFLLFSHCRYQSDHRCPSFRTTPLMPADSVSFLRSQWHPSQGSDVVWVLEKEGIGQVTALLHWNSDAYFENYGLGGDLFHAVLGVGSLFLLIPGICDTAVKSQSGCHQEQGISSGFPPKKKVFGGNNGEVEWKQAPFSFVRAAVPILGRF